VSCRTSTMSCLRFSYTPFGSACLTFVLSRRVVSYCALPRPDLSCLICLVFALPFLFRFGLACLLSILPLPHLRVLALSCPCIDSSCLIFTCLVSVSCLLPCLVFSSIICVVLALIFLFLFGLKLVSSKAGPRPKFKTQAKDF
jgi:hypothetical protein